MDEARNTEYFKSSSSIQFDSLLYFPTSVQNYQKRAIHFYLVSKKGRRKPSLIFLALITRTIYAYYSFQNTDETLIKKISPFLAPFLSIQDNSIVVHIQLNIQFVEYNDFFDITDPINIDTVSPTFLSITIDHAKLSVLFILICDNIGWLVGEAGHLLQSLFWYVLCRYYSSYLQLLCVLRMIIKV